MELLRSAGFVGGGTWWVRTGMVVAKIDRAARRLKVRADCSRSNLCRFQCRN